MNEEYPGLFIRIKAATIDGIILVVSCLAASDIFSNMENPSEYLKIIVFSLIFLLYEPLMISISGATIGHQICKIRVREIHKDNKINFFFAILRFITKAFLGWISLFTITTSRKKQAIHDSVANSIVVFDDN
ncbi:RDD family protein [Tenacibaculum sp. MEBiC06402]|uniref:RDD family protein n=1 Tax=unclassified Tenacibaculum TaxID=2635139 RepID=UPI003B9BF351